MQVCPGSHRPATTRTGLRRFPNRQDLRGWSTPDRLCALLPRAAARGGRVQVLLAILGFPAALVLPIPGFISVDYRSIIDSMRGSQKDKK